MTRRMRPFRWIVRSAVVASALLCAAVVVLWVRSYHAVGAAGAGDEPGEGALTRHFGESDRRGVRPYTVRGFCSANGVLGAGVAWGRELKDPPPNTLHTSDIAQLAVALLCQPGGYKSPTFWQRHGLSFTSSLAGDGADTFGCCVATAPHWLLALAAGAGPTLWVGRRWRRRQLRRRRLRRRECVSCGYDLRATPAAGGALLDRCPECGRSAVDPVPGGGAG